MITKVSAGGRDKMNKGIKRLVLIMFMVCLVMQGFSEAAEKKHESKVKFFSKNSVYVYGMGSSISFDPDFGNYSYLQGDSSSSFAPVVGLGFRVLNFANRSFINVEFDYTPGKFDYFNRDDLKVEYFSLMANAEMRVFRRNPVSFFLGIGASVVSVEKPYMNIMANNLSVYYGDDSRVAMAVEIGTKYPISKKLFFRSAVRFYGDLEEDEEYEYDFWGDGNESNSKLDAFSTSITVGFEFHF